MLTISIITIIIIFSLPLSQNKINSIIIRRLCAICLLYAGVLSFNTLYIQLIGSGIGLYNNFLQVNIITSILSTFILLISSIIVIIWPITESIKLPISNFSLIGNLYKKTVGIFDASPGSNSRLNLNTDKEIVFIPIATRSQETNKSRSNEYCLIILFNILGAILLMSSLDFITMFLSIELQSFALYILVSIYKDKKRSTSAGLKYFLLGGLSSSLILFGAAIIYSYTGSTNLDSIHQIISIYFNSTDQEIINLNTNNYFLTEIKGISLGILFIFSGFLFKIAAAPFHNWAPDVYDDSQTIVTIWLTIMPKISILMFLLQLLISIDINLNLKFLISNELLSKIGLDNVNTLLNLLLLCSLLSLIIGAVLGLSQTRIKRLLAYSTINHIGFLLLSLAVYSNSSIEAFIFYIIQYTITNLNIFLILLAFGYLLKYNLVFKNVLNNQNPFIESDIEYLISLKGLFYKNPLLSISLAISLFSLAGIPPLLGFFGKQQVLYNSISAGYYFISIIAILVSVISAYYYLKIIRIIFTDTTVIYTNTRKEDRDSVITNKKIRNPIKHLIIDESILTKYEISKIEQDKTINTQILSNIHCFIIGTLTLSIILFIFNPEILFNLSAIITSFIFNI